MGATILTLEFPQQTTLVAVVSDNSQTFPISWPVLFMSTPYPGTCCPPLEATPTNLIGNNLLCEIPILNSMLMISSSESLQTATFIAWLYIFWMLAHRYSVSKAQTECPKKFWMTRGQNFSVVHSVIGAELMKVHMDLTTSLLKFAQ